MSLLPLPERGWVRRAACVGLPPEMFFPERDETGSLAKARQVCAGCPVKRDCLTEILATPSVDDLFGIYAGTSAKVRRKMRLEIARRPVTYEWSRFRGRWIQTVADNGKSASIRLAEPPIE